MPGSADAWPVVLCYSRSGGLGLTLGGGPDDFFT
jgi:hypothetical protein